jgi:hypothetical protein
LAHYKKEDPVCTELTIFKESPINLAVTEGNRNIPIFNGRRYVQNENKYQTNKWILCEALLPIFQEAGPSNNKRKRSEDHLAVEDGEVFQRLRELCPQRTPAFIKVRRRSCLQEACDKNAEIFFKNI